MSELAQEAGYFPGWIMPVSSVGTHCDNMYFWIQQQGTCAQNATEIHFGDVRSVVKRYAGKKLDRIKCKFRRADTSFCHLLHMCASGRDGAGS